MLMDPVSFFWKLGVILMTIYGTYIHQELLPVVFSWQNKIPCDGQIGFVY